MRKIKAVFLLAAVTALLMTTQFAMPASAASGSDSLDLTVTYKQTEARSMLSMVNDFRTGSDAWYWNSDNTTKTTCSGLSKLTYDYNLEKVAMQRAVEIVLSFSHTRPDGTDCWTAYNEKDYSFTACAENIAAGSSAPSAAAAFSAFQETNCNYSNQGHRRNMLSGSYNVCAFACVYYNGTYYWVQEFAKTKQSSSTTSANDKSTSVSVNISADRISSLSLSASPTSISLYDGGSANLPSLKAKILFKNGLSTLTLDIPCTWKSGSSSIAEISGGKLKAKNVGDTKLSTSYLGKTVSVPVTVRKNLSQCKMTLGTTSYTYDGSKKEPSVTVKDGSTTLKKNTDYTIAYSGNQNIGTATVKVTGKGNYSGTLSKTFKITIKKGATYTVGDFVYKITNSATNGNGTAAVTGPASRKIKSAAIKAYVKIGGVKFKITRIAVDAFSGCTKLKTVTVGTNVANIGNRAFYGCTKMTEITIKTGLTRIGKKAFYGCSKLKTIKITSKKLTTVGSRAFKGINSNATIKVPKSKLTEYTALLNGKGQSSTVTITKK